MNTDGHRFSEALTGCPLFGVRKTIWLGISLVAPKILLSVLICVNLWLKNFIMHALKTPLIRTPKFAKTPAKPGIVNPRQA
jgi:hypothetical protein